MNQESADKAVNEISQRLDAYSLPFDFTDDALNLAIRDGAFAILAITGDSDITYVAHDVEEDTSDYSWSGKILAMTQDLVVTASVHATRNRASSAKVTARPRRLIESVSLVSVDRFDAPAPAIAWPRDVHVQLDLAGEKLELPLGAFSNDSAKEALVALLPSLIENSLAS